MPRPEFVEDPELTKVANALGTLNIRLMTGRISPDDVKSSEPYTMWAQSLWGRNLTTQIVTAAIVGRIPSKKESLIKEVDDEVLGGSSWSLQGRLAMQGVYVLPAEGGLDNSDSPFWYHTRPGNTLVMPDYRGNIILAQVVLRSGNNAFVPFVSPAEDGFTKPLMTKFEVKVA